MSTLPDHGVRVFMLVAWNLWKARNRRWSDKIEQDPGKILSWALHAVADLQPISRKGQRGTQSECRAGKWCPPAQGLLKLNSDAGVFSDGSVGLGFVVRDELGTVVLAGAKRFLVAADNSTLIEALALRFGAASALNYGLAVALLESDSRNLVRAIRSNYEVDVLSTMIIDDIADLVCDLGVQDFSFVGREANRVAHFLAHSGTFVGSELVWDILHEY
ncbi:hypothetical protein ACS0TY_001003 [Phlomoides rotata]